MKDRELERHSNLLKEREEALQRLTTQLADQTKSMETLETVIKEKQVGGGQEEVGLIM